MYQLFLSDHWSCNSDSLSCQWSDQLYTRQMSVCLSLYLSTCMRKWQNIRQRMRSEMRVSILIHLSIICWIITFIKIQREYNNKHYILALVSHILLLLQESDTGILFDHNNNSFRFSSFWFETYRYQEQLETQTFIFSKTFITSCTIWPCK